ncbi:Electron transfer flavoprotein subunit alpha mitochondrial [Zea mays]|nr:Electron transfer flavoprotein subunit alpha mitochondrial [Zea mays]AQK89455.1 Electron transfer flavoprotein subunit alpha mitochondrial [Zea mays]AQK89467.1 Electron transfer flavoprotein subunit alpha mitochondrial [Zea mays]|eukprot:XP_008655495.1 electron transfer flavoprotein subunit alpha, mitochondrial [Zea mays]
MMSIRSTSFSPTADAMSETKVAPITQVDLSFLSEGKSTWVNLTSQDTKRHDLANACVVVTGGRGLRSAENFKLLEQLAEKFGAAAGATRAAVEAGYVPNDLQSCRRRLQQLESQLMEANRIKEEGNTGSIRWKENILDQENELQNIKQENDDLQTKESAASEKIKELSSQLTNAKYGMINSNTKEIMRRGALKRTMNLL